MIILVTLELMKYLLLHNNDRTLLDILPPDFELLVKSFMFGTNAADSKQTKIINSFSLSHCFGNKW